MNDKTEKILGKILYICAIILITCLLYSIHNLNGLGKKMNDYIDKQQNIPNSKADKILKETDQGIGLIESNNIEDLFDELGI